MTGSDDADRLLDLITVDCYNAAEQMTAFYEVFAEEVPLPAPAAVAGATVRVVAIGIAEHGEELTARCQREEAVQDLRLTDLMFAPDAPAAWIHAAYRRCMGLNAHPTAMPAGWKPAWL